MPQPLIIEFVKMEGAGNDFIVLDTRFVHFGDDELARLARTLCPRRTGIGADGLLAFTPAEKDAHDYRMRYVNADGSWATMCGNGARCLARFARRAGIDKPDLTFESDAGVYRASVPDPDEGPVRLFVPAPRDFRPDITLASADPETPVHYVWTGTEHAVCLVNGLEAVDVEGRGRAIRHDPALAPAGANANFVEVVDARSGAIRVRTYEKGVEAETRACGTGALAAGVVARLTGAVDGNTLSVEMHGGALTVGIGFDGDRISDLYLEGPARTVFRGTVEVDPPDL